jgi:hypothetical protein
MKWTPQVPLNSLFAWPVSGALVFGPLAKGGVSSRQPDSQRFKVHEAPKGVPFRGSTHWKLLRPPLRKVVHASGCCPVNLSLNKCS